MSLPDRYSIYNISPAAAYVECELHKMTKRLRDRGIQVIDCEPRIKVDKSTNTDETYDKDEHSYDRYKKSKHRMNHRTLINTIIASKESTIKWCKENKLIKDSMMCDKCNIEMKWVKDKGTIILLSSYGCITYQNNYDPYCNLVEKPMTQKTFEMERNTRFLSFYGY